MTTQPTLKSPHKVVSDHHFARVILNKSTGQKALYATIPFRPGEVICAFGAGKVLRRPTYLTVQTGKQKHITLMPEFLQYINHSCAPTVFFDTTRMELICLKELQPGEELTFFYPSTEWDMAQPFACYCGSPECLQFIQGAAHISPDILEKYTLTDFILESIHRQMTV